MQQYKIEITYLAEQDMESLTDYIAFELKNPSAALLMVYGIRETIDSLRHYPERHELDRDEELTIRGIRRIYYKNYKIYYAVDGEVVKILRILHMLTDSKLWFCDESIP